jgi:uncharacterized protein (TIGR00725 family)
MRTPIVSIIGDGDVAPGSLPYTLAYDLGRGLVDAGFRVLTGGRNGVMAAAHRGAHDAANYVPGATIAILPGGDVDGANEWADIVIPTDLDHARNVIVAQSRAVIAVGGRAGTLSEMAYAWHFRRLLIGLRCGGWSEKLADTRIDDRERYPAIPEDRVYGASDAAEALALVVKWLPAYDGALPTIR